MAYATFTKPRGLGDLVRVIVHPGINYVSAKVKNAHATLAVTAAVAANPLGQPVKLIGGVWELVVAADIANAQGLLLEDKGIPALAALATSEDQYLLLVRGPAMVHEDALPATDHQGAAINQTNFKAALVARDIQIMTGPVLESTMSI